MIEQWNELKTSIIELRDNDGTGTQQEICKFIVNLMDVLEKQMQEPKTEPCEDCISRAEAVRIASGYCHWANIADELKKMPSVQPKTVQEPCDDCISRGQTMNALNNAQVEYDEYYKGLGQAKQIVVDLPSVQPKVEQEPCEDCISREAVINVLKELLSDWDNDYNVPLIKARGRVKDLPSVKPQEQKTDVLDKIIAEINTSNRGTCDYYIVDRVEEIINEYKKIEGG